jgi:hypothetical protein
MDARRKSGHLAPDVRRWTAARRVGSAKAARACAFRATKLPRACGKIARTGKITGSRLDLNGSRIMYQSDITQFINQLKEQKPSLEEEQRRGRALLWDKQPIDLDERTTQQQSRVNQTPYVYYQNF